MARLARFFVPGSALHVIQRGHNRAAVFHDDLDRQRYLMWLIEASQARDISMHAFVLMDNHVHLLLTAPSAIDLSRMMQGLNVNYVRHINKRYGRSGTLWEGRFRSSVILSERYLLACYRYIDLNRVRAGAVTDPLDWPWSSYAHHVGEKAAPWISDHSLYWALGNTPYERQAAYKALCAEVLDAETVTAISQAALTGRATGEPANVPARRNTRGRPRKN